MKVDRHRFVQRSLAIPVLTVFSITSLCTPQISYAAETDDILTTARQTVIPVSMELELPSGIVQGVDNDVSKSQMGVVTTKETEQASDYRINILANLEVKERLSQDEKYMDIYNSLKGRSFEVVEVTHTQKTDLDYSLAEYRYQVSEFSLGYKESNWSEWTNVPYFVLENAGWIQVQVKEGTKIFDIEPINYHLKATPESQWTKAANKASRGVQELIVKDLSTGKSITLPHGNVSLREYMGYIKGPVEILFPSAENGEPYQYLDGLLSLDNGLTWVSQENRIINENGVYLIKDAAITEENLMNYRNGVQERVYQSESFCLTIDNIDNKAPNTVSFTAYDVNEPTNVIVYDNINAKNTPLEREFQSTGAVCFLVETNERKGETTSSGLSHIIYEYELRTITGEIEHNKGFVYNKNAENISQELLFRKAGNYSLSFYAVDNAGNVSNPNSITFSIAEPKQAVIVKTELKARKMSPEIGGAVYIDGRSFKPGITVNNIPYYESDTVVTFHFEKLINSSKISYSVKAAETIENLLTGSDLLTSLVNDFVTKEDTVYTAPILFNQKGYYLIDVKILDEYEQLIETNKLIIRALNDGSTLTAKCSDDMNDNMRVETVLNTEEEETLINIIIEINPVSTEEVILQTEAVINLLWFVQHVGDSTIVTNSFFGSAQQVVSVNTLCGDGELSKAIEYFGPSEQGPPEYLLM